MKHFALTLSTVSLAAALSIAAPVHAAGSHAHTHGHSNSAIGQPGDAAKVTRTIEVEMTDAMRFTPSDIRIKRGETVRFVVRNTGKLRHEMVLGSRKDLQDHAIQMQKFPDMEHEEPNQVVVEPGKSGELVWHFTRGGIVDMGCLQPGHYEAGMHGKLAIR